MAKNNRSSSLQGIERGKWILAKWKFESTINNWNNFLLHFQPLSNSKIHIDKKVKQIKLGGYGALRVHFHNKLLFCTQNKYDSKKLILVQWLLLNWNKFGSLKYLCSRHILRYFIWPNNVIRIIIAQINSNNIKMK